jgi:hypothetical protein
MGLYRCARRWGEIKTVAEPGTWEYPLPTVTPEEKPAAAPRRAALLSSYLKAFSD